MNEFMTISEAAETLNVTMLTMRGIIKRENLTVTPDPVDSRQKLVSRWEIEKLKASSKPKRTRSGRYVPTKSERAMLMEALADEEAEDREGSVITLEDIEKMVADMIEDHHKGQSARAGA
jgi:hypothetical protein